MKGGSVLCCRPFFAKFFISSGNILNCRIKCSPRISRSLNCFGNIFQRKFLRNNRFQIPFFACHNFQNVPDILREITTGTDKAFIAVLLSLSCRKPRILGHVQFIIFTFSLKKRFMIAALYDFAVIHNNNKIGIPDC